MASHSRSGAKRWKPKKGEEFINADVIIIAPERNTRYETLRNYELRGV